MKPFVFSAVLALLSIFCPCAALADGPLRVHPENPRYFADATGEAILLTGSHTWENIVDIGPADPPPAFDFDEYLACLKRDGHNFIRGWRWEPTKWDTSKMGNPAWRGEDHTAAPHPWLRPGPDPALDGRPKFDLEQLNPEYLERLRQRVSRAQQEGIYISIMLFEGFGVQFLGEAWPSHPFNPANNINGIDGDKDGDGRGIEIHQMADPAVTKLQETYVRWVVEGLNGFDNLLYEITNEAGPYSTDWQYHMIRFIKEVEKDLPLQHPVGMTYQEVGGSNDVLYASPADWVSPGPAGGFRDNPPDIQGAKVVLIDSDHLWGVGGDASWVWKSVTRGLNPIFMDPYDGTVLGEALTAAFGPLRKALGQARQYTGRMNLARAAPQDALASTGYCLAEPGVAYLVFAPEGGEIAVDLTADNGPFAIEWLNPASGESVQATPMAGDSRLTLHAPFDGAAVLFLTVRP